LLLAGYVVLGKIKYSKDVDAALKGKDKADSAAFFSSAELAAATLLCLVDEESKKSHFLLPSYLLPCFPYYCFL